MWWNVMEWNVYISYQVLAIVCGLYEVGMCGVFGHGAAMYTSNNLASGEKGVHEAKKGCPPSGAVKLY